MSPERISIILDTVSFFFVTIDLYGEERLTNFHDKIEAFLMIIVDILCDIQESLAMKVSMVFGVIVMFAGLLNTASSLIKIFKLEFTFTDLMSYFTDPQKDLIMVVIDMASTILGSIFALFFAVFIVLRALKLTTKFLQSIKLPGVLLTLGTILFVISKSIVWIHTP